MVICHKAASWFSTSVRLSGGGSAARAKGSSRPRPKHYPQATVGGEKTLYLFFPLMFLAPNSGCLRMQSLVILQLWVFFGFDEAIRIILQREGCIIIININSNKSLLKVIKMKGDGYRSHHSELTPSSCVN